MLKRREVANYCYAFIKYFVHECYYQAVNREIWLRNHNLPVRRERSTEIKVEGHVTYVYASLELFEPDRRLHVDEE